MLTDKRSLSYVPLMLFPPYRTAIPPRTSNHPQSIAATGVVPHRGGHRAEFPRNSRVDKPRRYAVGRVPSVSQSAQQRMTSSEAPPGPISARLRERRA